MRNSQGRLPLDQPPPAAPRNAPGRMDAPPPARTPAQDPPAREDASADRSFEAAFKGSKSQNPVTWVLGPIAGNPFSYGNPSLSENRANPIEYYFYRARYYEPGIGRFTQRDPMPVRDRFTFSLNDYAYAINDPISFVDAFGLVSTPAKCIDDLIRAKNQFKWISGTAKGAAGIAVGVGGAKVGAAWGTGANPGLGTAIGAGVGFGIGWAFGHFGSHAVEDIYAKIGAFDAFRNCLITSCQCTNYPDRCESLARDMFKLYWEGVVTTNVWQQ